MNDNNPMGNIASDMSRYPDSFANEGVLRSSQGMGWSALQMETRLHSGGEFHYAPSGDHLISLHLGPPLDLECGESPTRLRCERVEQGSAIVIPAQRPSLWRHTEPSHFLNIQISASWLELLAASMGITSSEPLKELGHSCFQDLHLQHLATLLRWEMEAGAPYGPLYAETLAQSLGIHLLQRSRGQSRFPQTSSSVKPLRRELKQAVEYIHDNLAQDLSIETLAHAAGLSPHHFAHLFAQAVGVPPHRYVIQARIERAKLLLQHQQLTALTVAQQVGFADQSHFTRHFKRLVGLTPSAFAAQEKRKLIL